MRSGNEVPQTGGCQCGAIRYEIREAPHLVYTCHCTECQRLTGSVFSMELVVQAPPSTRGDPAVPALTQSRQRAHGHSAGLPRFAAHGSGAARSPTRQRVTQFASAPARWTTPLGCVRQRISGPAARGPGSCCPRAIGGSRRSQEASSSVPARTRTASLFADRASGRSRSMCRNPGRPTE